MKRKEGAIHLFIVLLIFWYILTSAVDLSTTVTGVLVALMVVLYNYDLTFRKDELLPFRLTRIRAFFVLSFLLIRGIIRSNIEVARIVLNPKLPIEPGFVRIRQPLKKDLGRALYANSITLTPGTLTVGMDDRSILVHGLLKKHVKDLENSAIERAFVAYEEGK
ncbi:MAG: Na+/H+ antiporter subunit E [Acholeplasmataceae bacterium]